MLRAVNTVPWGAGVELARLSQEMGQELHSLVRYL